jgi:Fe-S-cluster containining protein
MAATARHNGGSKLRCPDMSCNSHKIRFLREQIPSFECVPGCHDCCGPVTTSAEEMARLPRKTAAEQEAALAELNCVHLGPQGCTVYEERPVICRLFGTTPRLPCPNGRRPEEMVDAAVERQVHRLIASTRQVLV